MIPILFESNETTFDHNGLGRLRDCISCKCVEERNSVYEVDFEYPVTADDFNDIRIGRIIGVTHDDSADDIQPFDIVSYEKPIDGVVAFHAVHISYRQSYLTVTGKNINSLANAFARLSNYATPANPFTYQTDKTSTGYVGAFNGIPQTVRSMLGGMEGSILDAYGGEYEWDRFNVILHSARGVDRDFSIRYGVNMLDYNEELDSSGTYMACVPYWTDGTNTVVGDKQTADGSTITNRGECIPLDVSERFENKPTKAQVNSAGLAVMRSNNSTIPLQNVHVEFVRLQDMGHEGLDNLLTCKLCDTVNVIFPFYGTTGRFKIVKTVWDVLSDRYESMELGDLSVTLSEALGIGESNNTNYIMPDSNGNVNIAGNLTVNGHSTQIGFENNGNGTKTLASANSSVQISGNGLTLSSGTWLLVGAVDFPYVDNTASITGVRHIMWYQGTAPINGSRVTVPAYSNIRGFSTRVQTITTVSLTEATDFYIYGFQDSGQSMTVNYFWRIVRIA